MMEEAQKIMGLPSLAVTATTVRVPTLHCHGESLNVDTERPFELSELVSALGAQKGLEVLDQPADSVYPMGETDKGDSTPGGAGRDPVYVGRIRRDPTVAHGVHLWVVSDNLRKGAALNAVQIGECLLEETFA